MSVDLEPEVRAFVAKVDAISGFASTKPPTLPEHIAAWLTDRIQFGDLRPGEAIREIAIADHFDVSRGSVREAFRILDRDGLAVVGERRGAYVRAFNREELQAIFRLRAEVFAGLAALAAGASNRDPKALMAIEEGATLLLELARASPPAPVGQYITVRRAISKIISSLAGNLYLAMIGGQLEREVAMLWVSVFDPERRKRSAELWAALCEAVRSGDVEASERGAASLVLSGLEEIERTWLEKRSTRG